MSRMLFMGIFLFLVLEVFSGPSLGTDQSQEMASDSGAVERGEYLVIVLGCDDCHTPFKLGPSGPEPDISRRLSGHPSDLKMPAPPKLPDGPWAWLGAATNTAFAGPWGVSYATNLTPDQRTGLGVWTEEVFVKALKTGKHLGSGRPFAPPMPVGYSGLPEEDLKAIYAYLLTVPPIENRVPQYEPMKPIERE